MQPVEVDWSTATVASTEDTYALEVHFRQPSEPFWWEAFTGALEILSKETTGARWETIRGVGEPPRACTSPASTRTPLAPYATCSTAR